MTRPLPGPRSGRAAYLAIALVLIYLAVGLSAAACPTEASGSPHGHRHGGASDHGTMAHSLLCAWSCQASTPLDLTPSGPISTPFLVVVGILVAAHAIVFSPLHARIAARAPPVRPSPAF